MWLNPLKSIFRNRVDLAVVAVQGPDALTRLDAVLDEKRRLVAAGLLAGYLPEKVIPAEKGMELILT